MTKLIEACNTLDQMASDLMDALPKSKGHVKAQAFQKLQQAFRGIQDTANVLNLIRGYFLEHGGEESPFVKKIDELIPRAKKE